MSLTAGNRLGPYEILAPRCRQPHEGAWLAGGTIEPAEFRHLHRVRGGTSADRLR